MAGSRNEGEGKMRDMTKLAAIAMVVVFGSVGCGVSTFQVVREDRPVQFGLDEDGEVTSTPLPDDVEGPTTVETQPDWCHRNRVACGLLIGFGSVALGAGVGLGTWGAVEASDGDHTVVTHR